MEDLNGEEIIWTFYKKELQKTKQKEFRIKKKIQRKCYNYMSQGKFMVIYFIIELIENILLYKNELFSRMVHL